MQEIVRQGGARLRASALAFVRRLMPTAEFGARASGLSDTMKDAPGSADAQTTEILGELKRARVELEVSASAAMTLSPAIRALKRTEVRLGRPLRVAIVGEFNSGKSSLANLLARVDSLPTAVISNTRIPTLLYQARKPEVWAVHLDGRRLSLRTNYPLSGQSILRLEVGLPSPRLGAVQILDLPGLADPRFDESLADLATHHVDAALWCTVGTQAWKESEREAWEQLPARLRGRGLLVATHSDLLRSTIDREKLLSRLRREAGPSFTGIVLVSTTAALAMMGGDREGSAAAIWKESGADALDMLLDELLQSVRKQRKEAALEVTGRIAHHTLARLEKQTAPASTGAR
jgi:dynamin family protein